MHNCLLARAAILYVVVWFSQAQYPVARAGPIQTFCRPFSLIPMLLSWYKSMSRVPVRSRSGRDEGMVAMTCKIDLHVHTRYSGDNDADPEETIVRAIELGLHGIAITEHYTFAASEPIGRLMEKYRGRIVILRGVEFSAQEGHCLVYGVDTDKLSMKYAPISDLVPAVLNAGGVVIPSHPYRSVNSLGDVVRTTRGIAALEGYNGCNMHAHNEKAIAAAGVLGLPYTGGSDSHAPQEVGSCYTEFEERVTSENFIDRLKQGKYRGIDTRKISGRLMI